MNSFHKLTVGSKLIGGFLLVAIMGAIIGIQGIWQASKINDMAEVMYERETAGITHMAQANMRLIAAGRAMRSALLTYSPQESEQFLQERKALMAIVHEELGLARGKFVTVDGRAILEQAIQAVKAYEAGLEQVDTVLRREGLEDPREATESC